jgi:hypothetical protein
MNDVGFGDSSAEVCLCHDAVAGASVSRMARFFSLRWRASCERCVVWTSPKSPTHQPDPTPHHLTPHHLTPHHLTPHHLTPAPSHASTSTSSISSHLTYILTPPSYPSHSTTTTPQTTRPYTHTRTCTSTRARQHTPHSLRHTTSTTWRWKFLLLEVTRVVTKSYI